MKEDLLRKLIDLLSEKTDLGLGKDDDSKDMGDESLDLGDKPDGKIEMLEIAKGKPIDPLAHDEGSDDEEKNELDSAEHNHDADASCGPDCPVKMALMKKLGR